MQDTTSLSLRERQKQRRKHRIYSVAIQLFKERGFVQTTATDIAKNAHVSRGTFFNYYPYKESVLLLHATESLNRLQEQIAIQRQNNLQGQRLLEFTWFALADITIADKELIPPLMYELLNPDPVRSKAALEALPLIQVLASVIRDLPLRKDHSLERISATIADIYFMTALRWSAYAPERDFKTEMHKALSLVLHGMVTHAEPIAAP